MGATLGLESRERQELSDRKHSLFSRPGLPSGHGALLQVCPGVWSAINRTSVVLFGCSEGSGHLVLFPCLATLHCKLHLTTIECCLTSSCCSRFPPGFDSGGSAEWAWLYWGSRTTPSSR